MRVVTALTVALVLVSLGAATAMADVIDFESYSSGDIFGQDGWVKNFGTGQGVIGGGYATFYNGTVGGRRDLTSPITSGTVTFSVDYSTPGTGETIMYTGNNQFYTDAAPGGVVGTAACFGSNSFNIKYRNGDSWVTATETLAANTWHTYQGTMDLATKTWNLLVYLQGTSTLVGSYTNLGFRDPTNCDAISRIGIMTGSTGKGRFDNISIVPEPSTMILLSVGGLLAAVRRRK